MFTAMTHLNHKLALGLSLLLTSSVAIAQQTSANQEIDMTRIEYADRYIGIEELKDTKYHLWPFVEGRPGVVSFFKAICDSYYIDLWYMAEAYVSDPENADLGDATPQKVIIDPKHGYLCVDFHDDGKLMVECCYWRKLDGERIVAFNFNYDNPEEEGQYFTRYRTSDLLFYEYMEESKVLRPMLPPIVGVSSYKGIRLPQEGKDLTLADGRKLTWVDGTFYLNPPKKAKSPVSRKEGVPSLLPKWTKLLDFSPEAIAAFDDELAEDIYDIDGYGCSFYCGCNIGEQIASSTLSPIGGQNYEPSNAHDLSYKTAWVEGAKGPGIGEWIEYALPAYNPRITEIHVVNGIVRTEKAWRENGRVKVLEVQVNGKKHALLNLKDERSDQWFDVPTIGYADRKHLEGKPLIQIRFIIREIYPGSKYEDTGISDIYFDGIDVH